MARRLTKEEKIAKQLGDIVNDVTLDLDDVGKYMAYTVATVSINRLSVILESAIYEREIDEYQY